MTIKEIEKFIQDKKIKFIQMQFININGELHSVEKPISQLNKIINSEVMIDGSSIKGYSTITTSDLFLKPDWDTFMELKFLSDREHIKVARVICNVIDKNQKPFHGCPRTVLSIVEKKFNKQDYTLAAAFEVEFFFLKKDPETNKFVPADDAEYFGVAPVDSADAVKREIALSLEEHGFQVEAFHKEVAQGQHEINYKYSNALDTADKLVTFKWIVKTIAARHGLIATFMPKPFYGVNGSGLHTNISVFKSGKNIFERKSVESINESHQKFVTGLIKRAKEMCAITNPSVNSYKRLVPGYEAPNCIAWSDSNRSAMFRIPASIGNSTRIEQRNVDALTNPYLALSIIFEAGFEGLSSKEKPSQPVYENLFKKSPEELKALGIETLPGSLQEALQIASSSKFLKKVLGEHIHSQFLSIKNKEWDEYRKTVHDWEINKYVKY